MRTILNEKQWRQFLALEALELKNIQKVAQDAGVSKNTVRRGLKEMEEGELFTPGARQRKKGAGRKKKESQDENLLADLEGLLDPKGDPMSLVRWTTKSMTHLKQALQKLGHQQGFTVFGLLYAARVQREECMVKESYYLKGETR